jgi:hypothetical protein
VLAFKILLTVDNEVNKIKLHLFFRYLKQLENHKRVIRPSTTLSNERLKKCVLKQAMGFFLCKSAGRLSSWYDLTFRSNEKYINFEHHFIVN